jgi:type III restriction enzyme
VANVFGVPFAVIPFKANRQGSADPPPQRHHIHAVPAKAAFAIEFPRVEGYTQAIRNRITVDWATVPTLTLEPGRIPPEVEVKGLAISREGRPTLSGPGRVDDVNLAEWRGKRRLQELVFDLARDLAQAKAGPENTVPVHVLFPQLLAVVQRYLAEKVRVVPPADLKDVFLSPYYGWVTERLGSAVRPDASQGEAPEIPRYEKTRGPGSTADVSFWTSREVREVRNSHLNYVVADTGRWEQSAAYIIDRHPAFAAFAKNAGLGFTIPYFDNGQDHTYQPDFLIRLKCPGRCHLILETKGYDPLEEVKRAAAERWVAAVNAEGSFGHWQFVLMKAIGDVGPALAAALARAPRKP